jgi:hypothetical protein
VKLVTNYFFVIRINFNLIQIFDKISKALKDKVFGEDIIGNFN